MNNKLRSMTDGFVVGFASGAVFGAVANLSNGIGLQALFGFLIIGAFGGAAIGWLFVGISRENGWLGGVAVGATSVALFVVGLLPMVLATVSLGAEPIGVGFEDAVFCACVWTMVGGVIGAIYEMGVRQLTVIPNWQGR